VTSVSVGDVAKFVLEKSGTLDTWKLEKLCYYAQGWHLAHTEEPAFQERVKAWADGPVIPQLYHQHKGRKYVSAAEIEGDVNVLSAEIRETIQNVLDAYGAFDGKALRELSHADLPWRQARGDLPPDSKDSPALDRSLMAEYFRQELAAMDTVPPPDSGHSFVEYLTGKN
jgi:uncharacterized phage-associated protein